MKYMLQSKNVISLFQGLNKLMELQQALIRQTIPAFQMPLGKKETDIVLKITASNQ